MSQFIWKTLSAFVALGLTAPAGAQFVDDEFNGTALGSQWTWNFGATPSTTQISNYTFTGSHLKVTAAEGTDHFFFIDNHAFVEQNAPTGTNWEIVTKIDGYDPTQSGFQRRWAKAGLQLWQDNDHFVQVYFTSGDPGTGLAISAMWQTIAPGFDPDPPVWGHVERLDEFFLSPGGRSTVNVPAGTAVPPTIYFKIIKSTKGYRGQFSVDGSTWEDLMPLVRNPDSADGYFTNEKIRLFHSAGPDLNGVPVEPVEFDYARATAIAAPATGYADDEFNGTSLGPQWGSHLGQWPGTAQVASGSANLTPGNYQDFWSFVDRKESIFQDAPTATNFSVTTRAVGPTDLRPYQQWDAYGIMLWQDQCNWVYIANQRSDTNTNRVEYAFKRHVVTAEGPWNQYDFGTVDFGANLCPEYLRVEQNGASYTVQYSYDNVTWTTPATNGSFTFPSSLRNAQVHLFAKRVFDNAGPAAGALTPTAQFDWVHAVSSVASVEDWSLFD